MSDQGKKQANEQRYGWIETLDVLKLIGNDIQDACSIDVF